MTKYVSINMKSECVYMLWLTLIFNKVANYK